MPQPPQSPSNNQPIPLDQVVNKLLERIAGLEFENAQLRVVVENQQTQINASQGGEKLAKPKSQ